MDVVGEMVRAALTGELKYSLWLVPPRGGLQNAIAAVPSGFASRYAAPSGR